MEKIKFESKVISIGSASNDIYMEMDMIFLDTLQNLNDVKFTKEFLLDIETNKAKYIGLPLVGDMNSLTNGKYDKLTHKFNKKDNSFSTQALGSFVDFKINQDGEVTQLIASARVWKRFPKVCTAIEELFDSDNGLAFSYETYVGKYVSENGVKIVDVDESNTIIASCVVSTPANPNSVALTLCAAVEEDFINNQTLEGGEPMQRNKENFTVDKMFESSKIHIAELDLNQVRTKLYNKLVEKMENEYWKYDSQELGVDYMILKQYCTADLIKVEYSVSNNEVNIIDIYDVDKTYIKKNKEEDEVTIAELEEKVKNLETVIASKDTLIAEKDTEINTVKETLQTKETELAEVNGKLTTLSETVLANQTEIAELKTVKESYDTLIAEKQAVELAEKKTALKDKYGKLLSAEVLVEMAEAIESLDETKLNAKVVEVAMAKATEVKPASKETMTASRILDNVKIEGADSTSLRSKYSM